MNREKLKNELCKYPKEVLIEVFTSNCLFDSDRVLQDVKWEAANLKMDTLMAKDKEIIQKMEILIGKEDIKSVIKYIELIEQSLKINKKINSVMREQDKLLGIGGKGNG